MRRSAEKVGFSTVDSIRRVKKVTAGNCHTTTRRSKR